MTIDTAEARRARYRAPWPCSPRAWTHRRRRGPSTRRSTGLPHLRSACDRRTRSISSTVRCSSSIEAIEGLDERGAVAALRASDPAESLRGAGPEAAWILDPVVLDCALQVQLVWGRLHWDMTLLPLRAAAVRRYAAAPPPGSPIRHELRVRPGSRAPLCAGDHRFLSADGTLLAEIIGMQGAGSRALNRLAGVTA